MMLLADTGLLTPTAQYSLGGLLFLTISALATFGRMVYTRDQARIDQLLKTAETKDQRQAERDDRNAKAMQDSAVLVSKAVELSQKMLEANAVNEARERERANRAGH